MTSNGLDKRRWSFVRNRYLCENFITPEDYENLSYEQRLVINEIKKAFKNIQEKYETINGETNYDFNEEDTNVGSEDPPY